MRQWCDKKVKVLIVGAGPTGLMMACQIALRNTAFRIIDKKTDRTNYSGALIIQARSLEIFHQMGIAQTVIQHGIIANEIIILFNGKKSFRIPIKDIGNGLTKFPYLLMVEQSATEKLLTDFICNYGIAVERNTELLSFTQNNEGVDAILKLPDGIGETLKVKYLIAADGGRSVIREQLAIPFLGSTHSASLFVTDCKAEVQLPSDTICFSFSNKATTGFFPLTQGRWRIDGIIPRELETKETITFEDIAENFALRTGMKALLYQPQWFSVFHSHQRYASSFQQNRCYLTGDAAHVHSPVGAQGMNTGLQDACNLAWKLALVIQKKAKESLLDTYMAERQPIATRVIRSTDQIFKLVTSQRLLIKTIRIYVGLVIMKLFLPALKNQSVIRRFFFSNISEIGIH